MEYDAIVVPESEILRSTTLERLEAFRDAGGKLIFMGDAPKYEDAVPSERGKKLFDTSCKIAFSKGALLDELNDYRTLEIRNRTGALTSNFIHQVKRDETGLWLFISHCDEPYNKDIARTDALHIYVNGRYSPKLYDTLTGEIKPISHETKNGKTHIMMTLYDYDSALFFLEDSDTDSSWESGAYSYPTPIDWQYITDAYNATARESGEDQVDDLMTVPYILSEPNVLLLDVAKYALDDEVLTTKKERVLRIDYAIRRRLGYSAGKPQPWVIAKKAAEHTVTLNSYISRRNCFGDVHNADEKFAWQGPQAWTTGDTGWTYEYRLRCTGILTTPLFYKK